MPLRLQVPTHLQRNSARVTQAGYEETGQLLIDLAMRRAGLETLAESDVLDVGCGVRFTQTILNRSVPIMSYTGIETYRPIVDFMREQVEPHDPRFRFVHWNVRNGFYNPDAPASMSDVGALPVQGRFDLIWLFSVFTHLDETDARAMLRLLRQAVRDQGTLIFTAFVDPKLDGVESRGPDHPLHMVFFGQRTMERLIAESGWTLRSFDPGGPEPFLQPCFVCAPR